MGNHWLSNMRVLSTWNMCCRSTARIHLCSTVGMESWPANTDSPSHWSWTPLSALNTYHYTQGCGKLHLWAVAFLWFMNVCHCNQTLKVFVETMANFLNPWCVSLLKSYNHLLGEISSIPIWFFNHHLFSLKQYKQLNFNMYDHGWYLCVCTHTCIHIYTCIYIYLYTAPSI